MSAFPGIAKAALVSVTLLLCPLWQVLAQAPGSDAGTAGRVRGFTEIYASASSQFLSLVQFDEVKPAGLNPATADLTVSGPPYELAGLLLLAQRGNPAIAISQSAAEAAQGDLAGALARRYPTLRAESSAAYLGNPQDAVEIPQNAFATFDIPNPPIPLMPAVDPFQYSFKLVGELPLFTWGKTGQGIKASESALVAARLQLAQTTHDKRLRLRATWEALACVAAAEDTLALQAEAGQRLASLAEQNLRSGFITAVELLDLRLKVKETALAQARLTESRERLLSELASLAGLEGLRLDQLRLELPTAGLPSAPEAEAQATLPFGNYDLALARAQIEARLSQERLASLQAKGLPDFGLRAELSYGGSRLPYSTSDWEEKTDWQLVVSIGASGSLFGDAVKHGAADRARAELNQARAQLKDGESQLRAFIRQSYLALELLRGRLEYSVLQQEFWAASLAQEQAKLGLGAGSESDYLGLLMQALGGLAEAYSILADYRAVILGLDGAAGMARP